ncbi:MAG: ABC transporter ATP-binding protein [Cellvibrionales bacterium]|nr:ABC transporter ATP-binding protein [Cellvibrionales bacterium]
MKPPVIEVNNLSVHYPIKQGENLRAVQNVTLSIQEGEVLGLVGESGSGKSTLGKAMIGLTHKTQGWIKYRGRFLPKSYTLSDFRSHAKHMQMIFQDPYGSLNPSMTIKEILREPMQLTDNRSRTKQQEAIHYWIEKVGLSINHLNRYPHEFSGGQRQRIGIARALILSPKFIICDEPISALDVSVQAQIINLLLELKSELSLTLLFIAHDLSMVRLISDTIAVMKKGIIVETGPSDTVFKKPSHDYTKMLIEANPIADPKDEKKRQKARIKSNKSL